jgi:hypothetical protein
MEAEPKEASYPWNLASSLDRLGVPDLAIAYMRRAIRLAEEAGDEEWSGAAAQLALADIAINARDLDIATLAIDQARRIDPSAPTERYRRLARRRLAQSDSPDADDHDAARKGTAIEHLIAATCMLASGFELNVSTNMVDDEGVDLVFHRREHSTTLAVQIKSRSWGAKMMRDSQRFVAQVRRSTFRPRPDFFVLFVAVDMAFGEVGPIWFVPSEAFSEAPASRAGERLRFSASAAWGADDRWSRFRHERFELHRRILGELDKLETAGIPTSRHRRGSS